MNTMHTTQPLGGKSTLPQTRFRATPATKSVAVTARLSVMS
jgi:hypothetical protein